MDNHLMMYPSLSRENNSFTTYNDWQTSSFLVPRLLETPINERFLTFELDSMNDNHLSNSTERFHKHEHEESACSSSESTDKKFGTEDVYRFCTDVSDSNVIMENDDDDAFTFTIDPLFDYLPEANPLNSFSQENLPFVKIQNEINFDETHMHLPISDKKATEEFNSCEMNDSNIVKSTQTSNIHKKYALSSNKCKRKKQKSISLPQSPEHIALGIESLEFPSSLCFEDLNEADFNQFVDDDINISPEKAFIRNFDINDAFDDVKKYDLIKKEAIETNDFFTSENCKVDSYMDDFDLPSFINEEIDTKDFTEYLNTNINNYCYNNGMENSENNIEFKHSEIVDNHKNTSQASSSQCSLLNFENNSNTVLKKKKSNSRKEIQSKKETRSNFQKNESVKIEKDSDTEDYIDVESVSDCETFSSTRKSNISTKENTSVNGSSKTKYSQKNELLQVNIPRLSVKQENIYLDHDYCFTFPCIENGSGMLKKNSDLKKNPMSNDKHRDLRKGKNMALMYESKAQNVKKEQTSLLKPVFRNPLPDANSKSYKLGLNYTKEHSYFKIMKQNNILNKLKTNKIGENMENLNKSAPVMMFKSTDKCEINDNKSLKNILILENGTKKVINVNRNNILLGQRVGNKNSLLLRNYNGSVDKKLDARKIAFNSDNDTVSPKQSLLKPIVKEKCNTVSLLKSNYGEKVLSPITNSNVKTQDSAYLTNENKPIAKIALNDKRKINLHEYKKRRDKSPISDMHTICNEDVKLSKSVIRDSNININNVSHSNNVSQNINCISMDDKLSKKIFDPISSASKKVLQLKKSSQKYNEDRIVKSKIPKVDDLQILPMVTENGKLLPMIKKIGEEIEIAPPRVIKTNADMYDAIIMVSVGVNTDNNYDYSANNVNKNSGAVSVNNNAVVESENNAVAIDLEEHKIIVHLAKNDKRPEMISISVQTETNDFSHSKEISSKSTNNCILLDTSKTESSDSFNSVSSKSIQVNKYIELLNRWKVNPTKKADGNCDQQNNFKFGCDNGSKSGYTSSSSCGRISRCRDRNAKYKYRRRRSSGSSNSSYCQNTERNRKMEDGCKYRHNCNEISQNNKDCAEVNCNSKRKRDLSMSPSEIKSNGEKDIDYMWGKESENYSASNDSLLKTESDSSRMRRRSVSTCSTSSASSYTSSISVQSSSSDASISSRSSYNNHSPKKKRNNKIIKSSVKNNFDNERKIVYVGMLEPDITRSELKSKFIKYGSVQQVTIHTKADGYGFVTFYEAKMSYKVLESASSDPEISHYDVFFGGRRAFCQQVYEDLDDLEAMQEESEYYPAMVSQTLLKKPDASFDRLLQETKAVLFAKKK